MAPTSPNTKIRDAIDMNARSRRIQDLTVVLLHFCSGRLAFILTASISWLVPGGDKEPGSIGRALMKRPSPSELASSGSPVAIHIAGM
jgi:hypothetical protein